MLFLPEPLALAATVDRPLVRCVLAAVVGLPMAAFALVYGWRGLALSFSLLTEGYKPFASGALLCVTVLGLLGIAGGWIRLVRRQSTMRQPVVRVTVALLWCGVAAAISLAATVFVFSSELTLTSLVIATGWTVVALIGLVLIHATPRTR